MDTQESKTMEPDSSRSYVLGCFSEETDQEEYIPVTTFNINEYQCGLKAGEYIKLKTDLAFYKADEIFQVLTGAEEDPSCLWLKDSAGEHTSWDDEFGIFEFFERIESAERE
jgi:hypothetical protein